MSSCIYLPCHSERSEESIPSRPPREVTLAPHSITWQGNHRQKFPKTYSDVILKIPTITSHAKNEIKSLQQKGRGVSPGLLYYHSNNYHFRQ